MTWALIALLTSATASPPVVVTVSRHPTHDACELAVARLPAYADTILVCTPEAVA